MKKINTKSYINAIKEAINLSKNEFLNENYEQTLPKINFWRKKILFNKTIIVGALKLVKLI